MFLRVKGVRLNVVWGAECAIANAAECRKKREEGESPMGLCPCGLLSPGVAQHSVKIQHFRIALSYHGTKESLCALLHPCTRNQMCIHATCCIRCVLPAPGCYKVASTCHWRVRDCDSIGPFATKELLHGSREWLPGVRLSWKEERKDFIVIIHSFYNYNLNSRWRVHSPESLQPWWQGERASAVKQ